MLDGLLGRGFSSKVKTSIKQTKARIDVIRRKRNAMQRFLKKDIADLLANGLDINAYGRAEGLYVELTLSSCYDAVEQFCGCIPLHLSAMQKQRECPEECKEAVSSLMFAAARFADLPELRDLRDIFQERYGKSLESFVCREFVDNLASKPPTVDKKLQLMREIAKEFSIKWDSKAFEQKISNRPAAVQEQPKRHESFRDRKNDSNKVENSKYGAALTRDNPEMPSRERQGAADVTYKQQNGRAEAVLKRNKQDGPPHERLAIMNGGYTPHIRMEENVSKKDDQDSSHGRSKCTEKQYKLQNGGEQTNLRRDAHNILSRHECIDDGLTTHKVRDDIFKKIGDPDGSSRGRMKHTDDGYKTHNGREDTAHRKDDPDASSYRKQRQSLVSTTKQEVNMEGHDIHFAGDNPYGQVDRANSVETAAKTENLKPRRNFLNPPYVKPSDGKYARQSTTADQDTSNPDKVPSAPPVQNIDFLNGRSERTQIRVDGVDNSHHHQDDLAGDKKAKPKSVRRRHLKPPSGHDYADKNEGDEVVKRKPSGRRREDGRRGLQHILEEDRDRRDEEERMMDKLLVHYSKKPSSLDANEHPRHRSRNGVHSNPEAVPPPTRAMSLPPAPALPAVSEKVPVRAASFQQDGAHVHPKLPDYDDLAARFAALKGR